MVRGNSDKRVGTRRLAALTLAACSLLLAACGGEDSSVGSGDELTIGWPRGPETGLDKAIDHGEPGIRVMNQLYAGLVAFEPDGRTIKPNLAEDWTISPDKKTYEFTLRPNVAFSDGEPITANDVVFSINETRADGTFLGYLFEPIKTVTAEGDSTVVIKLSRPYQPLLEYLCLWVAGTVPDEYGGLSREAFYEAPVSSGPWVLAEWTRGDELTLEPNTHWYGPKPNLRRVIYREIPDDQARNLQLTSDQVDMIADPSFGSLESLRADPDVEVTVYPWTNNPTLLLSNGFKPFQDHDVRRAISLAIDREALVAAATDGTGEPASSFAASTLSVDPLPPLPFDAAGARELMDGSTQSGGFEVALTYTPTQSGVRAMAQVLVEQLRPLGITVELVPLEAGSFSTQVDAGKFEMALYGDLSSDVPDLAEFAVGLIGTDALFTGSPVVDEITPLAVESSAEFNDEKREQVYNRMLEMVNEDASVIGLIQTPKLYAFRKGRVEGFDVNLLGLYDLSVVSMG